MNNRQQQIDNFFDRYRDIFNQAIKMDSPDLEQTAGLYADCFIGANPLGVQCGKNDGELRSFMAKGYNFYKEIGITSMDIVSKEITVLDEFHTMVKIRWKSNFMKGDNSEGSIEFDNIYFTQTRENQHKVFAWITGNEQAVLKEYGLI